VRQVMGLVLCAGTQGDASGRALPAGRARQEGDETGVDEAGVDETGVDETGEDETGVDEAGVDETGVDETGVDETGVDETGADWRHDAICSHVSSSCHVLTCARPGPS
jgi:hypothetical protein